MATSISVQYALRVLDAARHIAKMDGSSGGRNYAGAGIKRLELGMPKSTLVIEGPPEIVLCLFVEAYGAEWDEIGEVKCRIRHRRAARFRRSGKQRCCSDCGLLMTEREKWVRVTRVDGVDRAEDYYEVVFFKHGVEHLKLRLSEEAVRDLRSGIHDAIPSSPMPSVTQGPLREKER